MNLILASSFPGLPVQDSQGKRLGTVTGTLIDISNGVFVGLTVKKNLISPLSFINFEDIEDLYHSHIQVSKLGDIIPIKKDDKANNINKNGFQLIGLKVITESGKKIGKLDDMAISLNIGTVARFYVKSILTDRIIDRDHVLEITKKRIIVQDDMTYAKQDKIKLPKILGNKSIEPLSPTELTD